jgi:monofunctional biosynthetic peptidoglycan transglycosylase
MTPNEPMDPVEPKEPLPRRGIAGVDRALEKVKADKTARKVARPILIGALLLVLLGPPAWVMLYRFVESPGTVLMLQRAFAGEDIRRTPVRIGEISPHLVRAVIAAEDSRFCSHDGFDVEAIESAMEFNERQEKRGSNRRRGASTISQQTAKNLFLWPQRSWVRKGAETYFTFLIEAMWPKRRIVEAYLNAAEWGEGRFGAEAAARDLFGKSAKDLTPREAARMAAVLPSPRKWRADNPGPYVRRRAATIEQRMQVVRNEGLDVCARIGRKPAAKAPPAERPRDKAPAPKPEAPPVIAEAPVEAPATAVDAAAAPESQAPAAAAASAAGADPAPLPIPIEDMLPFEPPPVDDPPSGPQSGAEADGPVQ